MIPVKLEETVDLTSLYLISSNSIILPVETVDLPMKTSRMPPGQ